MLQAQPKSDKLQAQTSKSDKLQAQPQRVTSCKRSSTSDMSQAQQTSCKRNQNCNPYTQSLSSATRIAIRTLPSLFHHASAIRDSKSADGREEYRGGARSPKL
eukprot:6207280-Amphidinium_carterae.1